MKPRVPFLNDWHGEGAECLNRDLGVPERELEAIRILLASYSRDATYGEAFVLFYRNGCLYEVNASHDSDGQMMGQWEPEETLLQALRFRLERGRLGRGGDGSDLFASELAFLLAELEAQQPC